MTHQNDPSISEADALEAAEGELQAVLGRAGRRPEPSETATAFAYAAVKTQWQDMLEQNSIKKRKQLNTWLSIAASAAVVSVIAVTTLFLPLSDQPLPVYVATGNLYVNGEPVIHGQSLVIPEQAVVKAAAVSRITTAKGVDIRLSANTQLTWTSNKAVELQTGKIYIDTDAQTNFYVDTPFGQVRDIGTRFLVAIKPTGMTVAVREGIAEVDSKFGTKRAIAENQTSALIVVDDQRSQVLRESAAHSRWEWIHTAASGYEAQQLPMVLQEIARDLGKLLEYEDRGVEATIAHETIQGQLTNLQPRQALDLVTKSAGLTWQETENTITISFIQ